MTGSALQDSCPEEFNHCFGCGRLNEHGHHLRSFWSGDDVVASFVPRPYHMAFPGFVYGGLIASLIDCHGTGTAAASAYRAQDRAIDSLPPLRYVTASLKVDYLRPTPLGLALELRARAREIKGHKVVVEVHLSAGGVETARGEVVAVQVPETMFGAGEAQVKP